MKKTILVFPDTSSLVDFLLVYKIKDMDVNTADLTISGPVSEKLLSMAVAEYGAEIKRSKKENDLLAIGEISK